MSKFDNEDGDPCEAEAEKFERKLRAEGILDDWKSNAQGLDKVVPGDVSNEGKELVANTDSRLKEMFGEMNWLRAGKGEYEDSLKGLSKSDLENRLEDLRAIKSELESKRDSSDAEADRELAAALNNKLVAPINAVGKLIRNYKE